MYTMVYIRSGWVKMPIFFIFWKKCFKRLLGSFKLYIFRVSWISQMWVLTHCAVGWASRSQLGIIMLYWNCSLFIIPTLSYCHTQGWEHLSGSSDPWFWTNNNHTNRLALLLADQLQHNSHNPSSIKHNVQILLPLQITKLPSWHNLYKDFWFVLWPLIQIHISNVF